ncbi:hypothetical protein [uncultured Shimia sp.]|uniref:hypothetical protein n=1 Tax=uncultured Shimia sp. TaxID=573152 RepID=UPI0026025D43|nr:hypothetical protein [uncultured Shimia sp.]
MLLFLLSNLIFLAAFAWLILGGAGLGPWAVWLMAWFAIDYAVIWLTGYEPPAWMWTTILAGLGVLWAVLSAPNIGV